MTAPAVPLRSGDDPLDALKALKAQRAPAPSDDPLEQLKAMKSGGNDIHAEYASGRLAKRMQRENTNDAEAAAVDGSSGIGAFGRSLAATGANIAQGIPGMEAAQAGIRSVVRRQSYPEALSDIRGETEKIPGVLRVGEKMAGGVPLATLLPGSAAMSGAIIGGADQLLSADPDQSLGGRAFRTVAGAAGGALAGKVGEKIVTGAKALLPSKLGGVGEGADAALIRMQGERAQSAKNLFNRALSEGRQNEVSPAIHDFLAEDDIAPIVAKIRSGRTGATMDTPELLDRVYKELSDMQRTAGKSLAAADPSKPNAAVSRLADVKAAKQKMLGLMSKPTTKPPLTLDVAPEVTEVQPRITPGRETVQGPIPGADVTTKPFKYAGIRDSQGRLHQNLGGVPDDALEAEWRRLAELNAAEEAHHAGVQESGYRMDYEELPKTEKYGHVGKEDLPDADGMVDAERLAADNKIVKDYNKSIVVRVARQRAMDRIEREMQTRPPAPESGEDMSFDFGANVKPAGPAGPAFQLRGQPDVVKPGVRIETPGMRIQTAPAEQVPPLMPSYQHAVEDYAKRSQEIKALQRGYATLKQKGTGDLPPVSALGKKTPLSLADWAKTASPEEIRAARLGILGGVRDATALGGKTFARGRQYNAAAGPLLQKLPTKSQDLTEVLQNVGLLTAGNATSP